MQTRRGFLGWLAALTGWFCGVRDLKADTITLGKLPQDKPYRIVKMAWGVVPWDGDLTACAIEVLRDHPLTPGFRRALVDMSRAVTEDGQQVVRYCIRDEEMAVARK